MQIDCQRYLELLEKNRSILFVDIEASGLKGDYNSVLVVSTKPYGSRVSSIHVDKVGSDRKVVAETKKLLEAADAWVTYYGKGFDIPMLNTRLLRHGMDPIAARHHVDLYYVLRSNILTGRRSQGHLLSWLRLPQQKMSVSASDWADMPSRLQDLMPTMVRRCESDVRGLEALYKKTRHLIRDVRS